MSLDVEALVKAMVQAASKPLAGYGKQACAFAANEFSAIAQLIAEIGVARENETITPADAADLLEQAKLATKDAMDTQAGIASIAAEAAINAALGAVSSIVNGYLGFALI